DPRDPKTLRIAISSGGVWITHDDGATWELVGEGLRYDEGFPPDGRGKLDIQDVHQMKQCRSAPDNLWIQHHCGIFKSTDGGRNGRDRDATGTRLAMGSTPGGLWVSEDQGDHWQEVPVRLPPVHAVRFAA